MSSVADLDMPEIEAFAAVARAESFRAAAEDLDVAQSSVSQRIARLEQKLGRPLLTRTTRTVAMTEAGRSFLVYASAILRLAEAVRNQFSEPPRDGVLKLGIAEDYVMGALPSVLAAFQRHYPRFGFTLRTGLSAKLFAGLDQGTLDVVLAKRLPGRLTGDLLFAENLTWIGDASLAAGNKAVPLAVYPEPSETRQLTLRALRDAGRTWSILLESESLAGITAAARAGLAVAVLSRRLMPSDIEPLASLPPIGALEYVIDKSAKPHGEAVDAFISRIRATTGPVPG